MFGNLIHVHRMLCKFKICSLYVQNTYSHSPREHCFRYMSRIKKVSTSAKMFRKFHIKLLHSIESRINMHNVLKCSLVLERAAMRILLQYKERNSLTTIRDLPYFFMYNKMPRRIL